MAVDKRTLPTPPEGTAWSLRQHADTVSLRLRERGLRRRTLSSWHTGTFSRLYPDPTSALIHVANQMVATARPGDLVDA